MEAKVTYLDHSGFAVKTAGHFLVFDCMNATPAVGRKGLGGGVVDPAELAGENVFVFASHRHADHYNRMIFGWKDCGFPVHYILSDDIAPAPDALMVEPGREYRVEDVAVRTLLSTDEGVAFLANVDGLNIYHAGDLNWWHWEGEDPSWNKGIARDYREQLGKLQGEKIDIAFVPVDPRLKGSMLLGLDYFMRNVGASHVIPMHFWDDGAAVEEALASPQAKSYRDKVLAPMERGQSVVF